MTIPQIKETDFRQHVAQAGPNLMWFLGAGASRSSGLPTATDVTWDLKRRYYCAKENQDVLSHDLSNKSVQSRIQSYMDSKGFPTLWDASEYSFYFNLAFGEDYAAQQKYLRDALSTDKISLSIGQRVLAALLHLGNAPVVFTTNFDEVVETAYAEISGRNLTTFHLEGSYAAIDALNASNFPLYAKVHGDFRYQSIKNLSKDLESNDLQLQKCLIAAATRFGMIVSGYSGRDANVMDMFREAVNQNNAFPHGLFWTVPRISSVASPVIELIEFALSKGIKAGVVEAGTFDEMLSKIWRLIAEKTHELDAKVRSAFVRPVTIALPPAGTGFPILRTNALLITDLPKACGEIDYDGAVEVGEIKKCIFESKVACSISYTDRILFWGNGEEFAKLYEPKRVKGIKSFAFGDLVGQIDSSTYLQSMVEETIASAVIANKPLVLRKQNRTWYAVVDHRGAEEWILKPLRNALSWKDQNDAIREGDIHGRVFGLKDVFWAEAVSLKLEERNGSLWLLLRPDIWISPNKMREEATDYLYKKKIRRWNKQSYEILSAWIEILIGNIGKGDVKVTAYEGSNHPATFQISTRSAFSRRSVQNV